MFGTESTSRWAGRVSALLDQQFWCLGRDIARPQGNVLIELGMCCHRSRERDGCTMYTATLASGGSIFLWGFGCLYFEGARGVYLERFHFRPKLTGHRPERPVHHAREIVGLVPPRSEGDWRILRELLPALFGWFAIYEHWVAENLSLPYRAETLSARNKKAPVAAADMAAAWQSFAKKSRRIAVGDTLRSGPWDKLMRRLQPVRLVPDPRFHLPTRPARKGIA